MGQEQIPRISGSSQNALKADQPTKTIKKVKWVFGNLYLCNEEEICDHRTSFGPNKYCSWMLDHNHDLEHNFPCMCIANESSEEYGQQE